MSWNDRFTLYADEDKQKVLREKGEKAKKEVQIEDSYVLNEAPRTQKKKPDIQIRKDFRSNYKTEIGFTCVFFVTTNNLLNISSLKSKYNNNLFQTHCHFDYVSIRYSHASAYNKISHLRSSAPIYWPIPEFYR